MALQGSPRDMNKWREVLLDPRVRFPLRRSHRSAASAAAPVASRIVMGVTMAFMLLIMV